MSKRGDEGAAFEGGEEVGRVEAGQSITNGYQPIGVTRQRKSTNHFPHPNSKRENLIRHREDRGFEREKVKRVVPARGTYAWVHHSQRGVG